MRGDKIGVIGPNGVGKTTLLRLLLGQLEPQAGSVRLGTNLQIAYFDQLRDQLDEDATVQDNLGAGGESIVVNGSSRHVLGYLQDFLFTPERARTPVRFLSGGERNRLLLARLFSKPANVLVLDEPTNDLDTETLELLEERSWSSRARFCWSATIARSSTTWSQAPSSSSPAAFANTSAATTTGSASARNFPTSITTTNRRNKDKSKAPTAESPAPKRRLAYSEKRELDSLPKTIEKLDAQIAELHTVVAQPDFYKQPPAEIARQQTQLKDLEQKLAAAYARWEELEQVGE